MIHEIYFATIFIHIIAWPAAAIAQIKNVTPEYVSPAEQNLIQGMKSRYPDFRVIRSIEEFPELYNASVALPIRATKPNGRKSNRALVTLHDGVTGEPMESCYTPCTLHKEPGRTVFIFPYKVGHFTFPYLIEEDPSDMKQNNPYWDEEYRVKLGPDYRHAYVRGVLCEREFEKREKVDGDAEPCYRMPPPFPYVDFSGKCRVKFDVTPKGNTTNIDILHCTSPIFEATSRIALGRWKYYPKVDRGMAVTRTGVVTTFRYDVTDFHGRLLDETGKRVGDQ